MVTTTTAGAQPAERDVHLRDYWKVAWQGRWTVSAVFIFVLAAVAAWTFLQTPIFRAVAVVEVQPQARRVGPGQDVSGLGISGYGWFAEERYQNTQIEVIKSRDVATKAFQALGLANDSRYKDMKDPIGAFMGRFRVEQRRETGLIEISVSGADRDEIARWANALADAYVERNLDRARENTRNAVDSIKRLMDPLKAQLADAQQQSFDVLAQKQIYNPENQREIVKQRLVQLNDELRKTEVKLGNLRSVLSRIEEIQASEGDPMGLPDLAQDPTLQDLYKQKVGLEKEFEGIKVTYKASHPLYQEKLSQLQKLQSRVRDRVSLLLGQVRNEYELSSRNREYLQEEIRKAEEMSFRVGQATSQYEIVSASAQTRKQLYDVVTKTLNEVTIGADLIANNVSVLDHAIPPLRPIKPQKRLNLALGSVLGMLLGLGTVFFLDYLDNTFRTQEDIERRLSLNTLAVVPRVTGSDTIARGVKEAFQTLRTSLIFLSKNRERKVVLVTSTAPQEGKSSTLAYLARTLAGAGDRVVVLDCDLRKPTQHVHMTLERDPGLTNYLAAPRGMDDWRPYLKKSASQNLDVITCGAIPPNPPELLGSERFATLISRLRETYDWILFDSPPSISLSDAVLLSGIADMTILVVRHAQTDRDQVARSVLQFRNHNAMIAGVVLNDVDVEKAYRKDYYYAGYYYYDESGKGRRKRASAAGPGEVSSGAGA